MWDHPPLLLFVDLSKCSPYFFLILLHSRISHSPVKVYLTSVSDDTRLSSYFTLSIGALTPLHTKVASLRIRFRDSTHKRTVQDTGLSGHIDPRSLIPTWPGTFQNLSAIEKRWPFGNFLLLVPTSHLSSDVPSFPPPSFWSILDGVVKSCFTPTQRDKFSTFPILPNLRSE